jgi:serine/threonine protein kinase
MDDAGKKACERAFQALDMAVAPKDCTMPREQGRKSYVFFLPGGDVMKIQRPGQSERWLQNEIENMQRLETLGINSVDFPRLLCPSVDGDWLLMSRMGPALCSHWVKNNHKLSAGETQALGEQVGGFIAELYLKSGGCIHRDLHFANMTHQPNGRLGIIDFDDFGKGDPHEAFIKLMPQSPNIVPAAAAAFTRITGIAIAPRTVADLALATLQKNGAPETALNLVQANLAEWKGEHIATASVSPKLAPTSLILSSSSF